MLSLITYNIKLTKISNCHARYTKIDLREELTRLEQRFYELNSQNNIGNKSVDITVRIGDETILYTAKIYFHDGKITPGEMARVKAQITQSLLNDNAEGKISLNSSTPVLVFGTAEANKLIDEVRAEAVRRGVNFSDPANASKLKDLNDKLNEFSTDRILDVGEDKELRNLMKKIILQPAGEVQKPNLAATPSADKSPAPKQ